VEPDRINGEERRIDVPSDMAAYKLCGQSQVPPEAAAGLEAPSAVSPKTTAPSGTKTVACAVRSLGVLLRRLIIGPVKPPSAVEVKPSQPDHLRDCIDMLDAHPGLRTTTVRLLGPQAKDQGESFLHEHVETEDEKGNARQTDLYISYRCSNNHWLDQTVAVKGACWCGAILCSTPGCFAICQNPRCSAVCCPTHRKTVILDGIATTFCTRCFWKKYLFW